MIEIRLSPDGRIAQLAPIDSLGSAALTEGRRWLCMSWPDNSNLTANLLTDDEVANWQVLYHDGPTPAGPHDPQGNDSTASLSHNLDPGER